MGLLSPASGGRGPPESGTWLPAAPSSASRWTPSDPGRFPSGGSGGGAGRGGVSSSRLVGPHPLEVCLCARGLQSSWVLGSRQPRSPFPPGDLLMEAGFVISSGCRHTERSVPARETRGLRRAVEGSAPGALLRPQKLLLGPGPCRGRRRPAGRERGVGWGQWGESVQPQVPLGTAGPTLGGWLSRGGSGTEDGECALGRPSALGGGGSRAQQSRVALQIGARPVALPPGLTFGVRAGPWDSWSEPR